MLTSVILFIVIITMIIIIVMQLIEGEISLPSTAEMEADWKRWVARNEVVLMIIIKFMMITKIIAIIRLTMITWPGILIKIA